jgi:hypothetical protein
LVVGLGHWLQGNVDPILLLSLLADFIPGIVIGSLIAAAPLTVSISLIR